MAFGSFQTALSGMQSTQSNIGVIGNNIANVNTNGFKGSKLEFRNLLSQSYNNPASTSQSNEVGKGVKSFVNNIMNQGALEPTGNSKDIAIDGHGFFILTSGDRTEYSRVGSFRTQELDDKILLTDDSTGFIVQGWNAEYPFENEAPTIDTTDVPVNLEIPINTLERGRASNFVTISGNLNASEPIVSDTENTISSPALFDGQNPATGTTDLATLTDPITGSPNLLFPDIASNGEITVSALKGSLNITETFKYGTDGTTISQFMEWAEKALGITTPTDPTALYQPSGISIDTNGSLQIGSGKGEANAITEFKMSLKTDNETKSITNFTSESASTKKNISASGFTVIDKDGNTHQIDISFSKDNIDDTGTTWSFTIEGDDHFDATGSRQIGSGSIKFGLEGEVLSFTPNLVSFNYLDQEGNSQSQFLNLDMNSLAQLATGERASQLNFKEDGFAKSLLTDYFIADGGTIMGVYANGFTEEIGKIAVASFVNDENLARTSNGYWDTSNQNTQIFITESGIGKAGSIRSKFLESSNVKLTDEFTKLIIAQRSYQSASNALKVSNEILQSLADLSR